MRVNIFEVLFDSITMDEAVNTALGLIEEKKRAYVVTPNPEIVMMCGENEELRSAVNGAALVLPDGIGVIHAAKILKTPILGRITGIDFVNGLMAELAKTGKSVFLFGAKPGVAEKAGAELEKRFPGLVIAGTQDGYVRDDEAVISKINSTNPDFLFVCLGSPRQEIWMRTHSERLNAGLSCGLGGVLDVYSGEVKRAPVYMQRMGLEWFFRLLQEPRRAKRMLKLPQFLFLAVGKRLKGEK